MGWLRHVALAASVVLVLGAAASPHDVVLSQQRLVPAIDGLRVQPVYSGPQRAKPGSGTFSCQSNPISGSPGPRCYSPQQIQTAYGYSGLLASGVNGAGETIVIIDAFSNPYIPTDLSIQDSTFGLPAPTYHVVAMPGVPAFDINDPNQADWAGEITLDVLWAHAMAPGAAITLVEAASSSDGDLLAATAYAVDNNLGEVISQSFGEAESCVDPSILAQEHSVFQAAVNKGITLFASSGDSGASQFDCSGSSAILAVGSPASDPLVTAVGGTTLSASEATGTYIGETAWAEGTNGITCNPPDGDDIYCSGGGFSSIYPRPAWQGGSNPGRGVPDVSYDAGINGGVLTHCAVCNIESGGTASDPSFWLFGGTSAGSPQWAALTADAAQMAGHPLGDINPVLYQIAAQPGEYAAAFHDVTIGTNRVADLGGEGYYAGTGWDPVTGLGSPNAANLLPILEGPPTNTAPPVVSGTAAVGKVLTTTQGEWKGSPTSYTYQWQRCSSGGTNCTNIAGATSAQYQPSASEASDTIRSQVSATNNGGTSSFVPSAPTGGVIGVPRATAVPRIAGVAKIGRKLKANTGRWSQSPSRYRYQWLRCNAHGGSCARITGAVHSTYTVGMGDAGHRLRVRVTASNVAGKANASSTATRLVPKPS